MRPRTRAATLAACALLGGIAGVVPDGGRAAANGFLFVDGPGRFLLDLSGDGNKVLTMPFPGGPVDVIDRLTNVRTFIPNAGPDARISGDGSHVAFITTAALSPADTDGLADVYRRTVATGAVMLMTPGQPGWAFDGFMDVNADGTRVVATGNNPGLARTGPFLADGVTTTELGTALGDPIGVLPNGIGLGISDDARYVLYLTTRGASRGRLIHEDLSTGTRAPMTREGAQTDPADAVLSADGSTVAAIQSNSFGVNVVWRGLGGAGVLSPIGSADPAANGFGLSISRRGLAVTWTVNHPTAFPRVGTFPAAQLVRWDSPGTTRLASADPPPNPNGEVLNGMISDDASFIAFTSRASYAAGGTPGVPSVIGRAYEATESATPANASAYTARTPVRIVDTRIGLGAPARLPDVRSTLTVPVRGVQGVPANASAVAVQVAAAEGDGIGFVSLTPSGSPVGVTANLNVDFPGKVVANMAIVPIGANGAIDVFVQAHTHVVIDLLGWWTPTSSLVRAGRYEAVGPTRILDTRSSSAVNWVAAKPGARDITSVQVTGLGGVPTTGVRAVAINLAAAETDDVGFVQAAPGDALVPGASSTLNISIRGQVVSAATIVPVDAAGRIAIYTMPSTHLVIDVAGYFTDATAAAAATGLFIPSNPVRRILDTRPGGISAPGSKPTAGTRLDLPATGRALVGNLAVTETDGPGFVQLGPSVTMANGATANINPTGVGNTISNAFITPVDGALGIFTYAGTHIVIDVAGSMT